MITCPKCKTPNEMDHLFCKLCGRSLFGEEGKDAPEPVLPPHTEPPEMPVIPPAFAWEADAPKKVKKTERKDRRGRSTVLKAAVWTLVVICAGSTAYMLINNGIITAPQSNQNAGEVITNPDPYLIPPLVENVLLNNGEPAHQITIYGKDGDSVMITGFNESLTVQGGQASCIIPDRSLVPTDVADAQSSITASLKAKYATADGQTFSLDVPAFEISVPAATLELIDPVAGAGTVVSQDNTFALMIRVDPKARVFVNDANITSLVQPDGSVKHDLALNAEGSTPVSIVVEQDGTRDATCSFVIERAANALSLAFDSKLPTITEEDSILIQGVAIAGSTVTADTPLPAAISVNETTGIFSFTLPLETYGWHSVTVTASRDGESSEATYRIYKRPNVETYTKSAWKMDYEGLMKKPNTLKGQAFLCTGKIIKIDQSMPTWLFQMDVGTVDNPQVLYLAYDGTSKVEEGKSYRIFADGGGMHDNLPLLNARFIYPQAN